MKFALLLAVLEVFAGHLRAQRVTFSLDHVSVAVRDHDACLQQLSNLGFRVTGRQRRTTGQENSFVLFADNSYFEFVTPWDPQGTRGKVYAEFLAKREGAMQAAFRVSSMSAAIPYLRERGLAVVDSKPQAPTRVGEKATATPAFWTTSIDPRPLWFPFFFVEYKSSLMSGRETEQDNGTLRFDRMSVVLRNVDAAADTYSVLGPVRAEESGIAELGAVGRSVELSGSGLVNMLRAVETKGIARDFLDRNGEGILALGVRVRSLPQFEKLLSERSIPFTKSGDSLAVAPGRACGIRMEFH